MIIVPVALNHFPSGSEPAIPDEIRLFYIFIGLTGEEAELFGLFCV
jgi:hypothetical protein